MSTTEPIHPDVAVVAGASQLVMLPVAELHESPLNPRKYFAEEALAELAASIQAGGVRVPLSARPRLEGGGYEIAAGHRRYRAAKLAGVSHVPVVVRDMSDTEFLEVLTFDNSQREDVNALEEASGYATYMQEALADAKDVAAKIGKSGSYVYGRLKLLEAIPDAQRAFYDGKITAGHLELIARLEPSDQRQALQACEPPQWNEDGGLSVRDLKDWIGRNLHLSLAKAVFDPASDELLPAAGSCDACPHRLGNAPDFDPASDLAETCTRSECYQRKVVAFVDAEKVRLGDSVVLVSSIRGAAKQEGVIPAGSWFDGTHQPTAKQALIVDGPSAGRQIRVMVQERIPQPPAAAPQQQAPKPKPTKEEKERAAEQKRLADEQEKDRQEQQRRDREEHERKVKAEEEVRLQILRAIMDKVKWPPRREDILNLLPESLTELPECLEPVLLHEFGTIFPDCETFSDVQAARLIVMLAVDGDFAEYALGHGCDKLHAAAKRYGVDVAKIRDGAKEAEGGTRKEVVKKLPALGAKAAPKKGPAAKKAAPAKKTAKPAAKKKGGKKAK